MYETDAAAMEAMQELGKIASVSIRFLEVYGLTILAPSDLAGKCAVRELARRSSAMVKGLDKDRRKMKNGKPYRLPVS
jgi:hypothetical protein